jgi:short-subunit dehydrogenase
MEPLAADLATPSGVEAVLARISDLDDIELLVNNAGLSTSGHFLEQSGEKELQSIRVNIEALYRLTRAVVPSMVARNRGGVLNIASVVAFQPVPFWTTYSSTKAFVLAFGEGLAQELRATGVRVITVCPGFTRTALYAESGVPGIAGKVFPQTSPEEVVEAALRAYDRANVVHVVGLLNRLLAWLGAVTPRPLLRRLMGALFSPRTPPLLPSQT